MIIERARSARGFGHYRTQLLPGRAAGIGLAPRRTRRILPDADLLSFGEVRRSLRGRRAVKCLIKGESIERTDKFVGYLHRAQFFRAGWACRQRYVRESRFFQKDSSV